MVRLSNFVISSSLACILILTTGYGQNVPVVRSKLAMADAGVNTEGERRHPVPSVFNVSVASAGVDTIESGFVRVRPWGVVQIALLNVIPQSFQPENYAVAFCPFLNGTSHCRQLGSILISTEGETEAQFPFRPRGVLAGTFTFSREDQLQFVSGVYKPGRADFEYEVGLEPASTAPGILATGSRLGFDALTSGRIVIRFSAELEALGLTVRLQHALPNATYSVQFCSQVPQDTCALLTSVQTDDHGDVDTTSALPTGSYFGVFVLTRLDDEKTLTEYVTAFQERVTQR
jgi:hypothetical protein